MSQWSHVYGEGFCFKDSKCHHGYECISINCHGCKYFGLSSCYADDIIVIENALQSKVIRLLCWLKHQYMTKIRRLKLIPMEEEKRFQEKLNAKTRKELGY